MVAQGKGVVVEAVKRTFKFDKITLEDPDPDMTAEEVKLFYANQYPELLNAKTEEKTDKAGKPTVTYIRQTRTLG